MWGFVKFPKGLACLRVGDEDFPRLVRMLDFNTILVATNAGKFLLHNLLTKNWTTMMSDPNYGSYIVLDVYRHQMALVVAIGNIHGTLKLVHCDYKDDAILPTGWKEHECQIYTGKIFSIIDLNDNTLLTTGPDGAMTMWKILFTKESISIEEIDRYILPPCKHRWVSAASITDGGFKLVCGDRGGSVHLYSTRYNEEQQDSGPQQTFPKIHGKAGVTDVCCHGDYIYTAGRDGHYRQYSLEEDRLVLLNSSRVYKGFEWIDRLRFTEEDQDTHIYGFHSSDFVLWSVNSNQKLLQIPCGGGHRAWDCRIHDNSVRFIYLKTKDVVLCETTLQNNQILVKESLHGREVTDVKYIASYNNVHVIATCSEDTSVQIALLSYNDFNVMEMGLIQKLQGHISSVRALAISESGHQGSGVNRKLLFSAGGRAQLIVWRLTLSSTEKMEDLKNKQNVSCLHENLCNFMLGHDRGKKHPKSWRVRNVFTNPETRFMDLSVVSDRDISSLNSGLLHFLMAACSDGYVRLYCFKESSKELELIVESDFHDHCVLKVHYLFIKSAASTYIIFLSAGTDGRIAFWDMTSICSKFISQKSKDLECSNKNSNAVGAEKENKSHENFDFSTNSLKEEKKFDISTQDQNMLALKKDAASGSTATCSNSNIGKTNNGGNISPNFVLNLHQSGINSVDVYEVTGSRYLIGSGGDDNCLKISLVTIATQNSSLTFTLEKTGQAVLAHSAQITGVKLLSSDKCLSVSIDQRACIWDISEMSDRLELKMVCCKYFNVADIANIDVWKTGEEKTNILLGGVGFELISVSDQICK